MEKDLVKHDDVIEYVRMVQNGQTEHFQTLLDKCGQMIIYTLKKYLNLLRKYNIDVDDFKQYLHLSFFECIKKFPKEHKNFIAFTFIYLNNRALQFLNSYNKLDDEEKEYSLDYYVNDDENKGIKFGDTLVDETANISFNQIEDKIIREHSINSIKQILHKFISYEDIQLLFDIYGMNGVKTVENISIEYNMSIVDIIRWERLILLTLQTNPNLYNYYDELMCNVSYYYSYTRNKFRYSHNIHTDYVDVKNTYIVNKFEQMKERVPIGMKQLHKNIANATTDTTLVRITPQWKENIEKYVKYRKQK